MAAMKRRQSPRDSLSGLWRHRLWRLAAAAVLCTAPGFTPPAVREEAGMTLLINGVDPSAYPWVTSYVTVTNDKAQPVLGLEAGNFEVLEDGVRAERLEVTSAVNAQEPVSAVVVVDVSGSMDATAMAAAKSAAATFINSLGSLDSVSLVAFSTEVRLIHGFTQDKGALLGALEGLQPGGNTALYDALWTAIETAAGSGTARKIVVLETDGQNTRSQATLNDGVTLARAAGIPVYTIGLGRDLDRSTLTRIAESTGGGALFTPTTSGLEEAYRAVTDALRNQYLVKHYSPVRQGARSYKLTIKASQLLLQATAETSFKASPAPPVIHGLGVEDGAVLDAPAALTAEVESARPVTEVALEINGRKLARTSTDPYSFQLAPGLLGAGRHQVSVVVTDEAGATARRRLFLTVPDGTPRESAPTEASAPAPGIALPSLPSQPAIDLAPMLGGLFRGLGEAAGVGVAQAQETFSSVVSAARTFATETVPGFFYANYRVCLALLMVPASAGASYFQVKRLWSTARERLRRVQCPTCGGIYRAYQGECLRCKTEQILREREDRDLGTVLLENGLLIPDALEAALAESAATRTSLAALLLDQERVSPEQLSRAQFYLGRSLQMVQRKREVLMREGGRSRSFWEYRAFLPSLGLLLIALSAWALAVPLAFG